MSEEERVRKVILQLPLKVQHLPRKYLDWSHRKEVSKLGEEKNLIPLTF